MITNDDFVLSVEELVRYNEWAKKIAHGMGEAGIMSWTMNITFSFSNSGTDVTAHCRGADKRSDLFIRSEILD